MQKLHRLLMAAWCVVCVAVTSCSITREPLDSPMATIEPRELAEVADPTRVLVVDTRTLGQFAQGHVPDATRLHLSEVDLLGEQPMFPGYDMIVVYGQDPGSSAAEAMVKRLLFTHHQDVRLMEGGFDRWEREGLPVELSVPGSSE